MEMFVSDDEVERLEAGLSATQDATRLATLIQLAWHLRQRDTRRALQWLDEFERQSIGAVHDLALLERWRARSGLIRAEAAWLFADLPSAKAGAEAALERFQCLHDRAGACDANFLRASIAADEGEFSLAEETFKLAVHEARRANDRLRTSVLEALIALWATFRDVHNETLAAALMLANEEVSAHPAVATWVNDYLGLAATLAGDFAGSARYVIATYDAAMASGQIRRAILAAANAGEIFRHLNDHQAGLEWMQRGLDLARTTGWPGSIGVCLLESGEAQRKLQRYDAAQELLGEALTLLEPLSGSRNHALALKYLGELALDRHQYGVAVDIFGRLGDSPAGCYQVDLRINALRGMAHGLIYLNQPERAHALAQSALALAREKSCADLEIDVLTVLADLHLHYRMATPDGVPHERATLYYLHAAQQISSTQEASLISDALLDRIAQEYARADQYEDAYQFSRQANEMRRQNYSRVATNRAIAMQVQFQTERAQTDAEHHRALATAEAMRAEALHTTNQTLELLSTIGQQITHFRYAHEVYQILDRHVRGLLDATLFAVYLLDDDGLSLTSALRIEGGQPLPTRRIALDEANSNVARAARDRCEILNIVSDFDDPANHIPGTMMNRSALFVPLIAGDRLLGVMTAQSPSETAYGERERMIFRTLCAYGAIALDNANAYRRLEHAMSALHATQAQLLQKNEELQHAYREQQQVSLTDTLTGLRNRRFLLEHIDADVATVKRRIERLSGQAAESGEVDADMVFFLIDLDHFKAVNDRHGHAAGDLALIQLCERLTSVSRETDYLIRWGGEEFLVVARGTNRAEASQVADRIRDAVSAQDFVVGDGLSIHMTCSIGFAAYPFLTDQADALNWSQVLELADRALYVAKNGGCDRWVGVSAINGIDYMLDFPHIARDILCATEQGRLHMTSSDTTACLQV